MFELAMAALRGFMHKIRSTAGLGRTILRSKFLQNFGVAFCDAEERFCRA